MATLHRSPRWLRFRLLVAATVAVSGAAIVVTDPVQAATATVTSQGEGAGSLRTIVTQANLQPALNRIELPTAGPYLLATCGQFEDSNAAGDIDIVRGAPLTIVGTGSSPAVIRQGCTDRIFDVRGAGALTLQNVVIERGTLPTRTIFSTESANEFDGGGIRSLTADLTLIDSTVQENSAADSGGATAGFSAAPTPGNGGGIWSGTGDVTVTNSTIDRNTAGDGGNGDGLGNEPARGGDGGGIYSTSGAVVIDRSSITSNTAGDGGGAGSTDDGAAGGDGGGVWSGGDLRIDRSTVSRNTAGDGGNGSATTGSKGGDGGDGGGVFGSGSGRRLTSTGTEFRENSAGDGGDAPNGGAGTGGDGGGVRIEQFVGTTVDFFRNRAGHGGDSVSISGGRGGDGGAVAGDTVGLSGGDLTENSAGRAGASDTGRFGTRGGDGGAIAALVSADLVGVDAVRNTAGRGSDGTESGGDGGDGGVLAVYFGPSGGAPLYTIERSTFLQNGAGDAGRGPTSASDGNGGWGGVAYTVRNTRAAFDASNSTFAQNRAGSSRAAGKDGNGAVAAAGNVTMRYATVVANGTGAAISNSRAGLPSFDRITGSVFAENSGDNCDLAANQSGGYNWEHGGDTCSFNDPTDAVGQSATGLELLDTTTTPAEARPTAGGPLDERIPASMCSTGFLSGLTTDRNGTSRPGGGGCEPGAIEIGGPMGPPPVGSELDRSARFVPTAPTRIFDTRPGEPAGGPKGRLNPGQTIDVQFAGVSPIPSGAIAVVVNVTATETDGPSFVTAFPTGTTMPTTSSINITTSGQTRPNLVTVPVGAGGRVSFFTLQAAHLVGDVAGYYLDTDTATSEGRFTPLTPTRIFDSRPSEAAPGPKGKLSADQTVEVQVTGVAGVPAGSEATAVVVNLTATQADAPGFLTAFPTGQALPLASNVNLSAAGATAPNLAVIPIGTGGKISIYSSHGTHALADVTGYFTGSGASSSTEGMYVPLEPLRVFDTRPAESAPGPKGFVPADGTVEVDIDATPGIPPTATGVVLNVTGVEASLGFLTAFPTGELLPTASTLNFAGSSDVRANAAMLPLGAGGKISFYTLSGSHMLADTAGYFTGPS